MRLVMEVRVLLEAAAMPARPADPDAAAGGGGP